ncbi:MAG: inorganic phosphate transporter [Alphaproteobacteria bacterium]|nr:inorganic phosphate transporter [Alphaproteobacteria bacterium]
MEHISSLLVCVILAGLAFDFINGFHDASNSIATVVATKVLTPRQAVIMAAFFNVIAAFFFTTGVAKTVGSGLVSLDAVTPVVVLCGLIGATAWGILTWRFGLPSSSSHALLGGYAGSAMANHVLHNGWQSFGAPIIVSGWLKVLAFIVIAPLLGLFIAFVLKSALNLLRKYRGENAWGESFYRKGQLLSSAFLSLMHGSNDAQKTAGIITGALVASGALTSFDIPHWVLILSYLTMGLGTLFGGWRIVKTMGHRLTRLDAKSGVCAESAAALSIMCATVFHLPISTTHVVTGAILGVGAANDASKVRWSTGRRIAWAWAFTIPAAAFTSGVTMALVNFIYG